MLFHDTVSLQSHVEDVVYRRILTSLVFETLVKYLQVQSSQWHTLKTKQFSYYEQTRSQTVPEKEDGLETLMYLLRYLLQHLPETVLVLTGSSVTSVLSATSAPWWQTVCERNPTSSIPT